MISPELKQTYQQIINAKIQGNAEEVKAALKKVVEQKARQVVSESMYNRNTLDVRLNAEHFAGWPVELESNGTTRYFEVQAVEASFNYNPGEPATRYEPGSPRELEDATFTTISIREVDEDGNYIGDVKTFTGPEADELAQRAEFNQVREFAWDEAEQKFNRR